jgi:hypothetical protein
VEERSSPPRRLPARAPNLIVRRIGEETVVYDRTTDQAHCLNRVAAMVFEGCRPSGSPDGLCRNLEASLGVGAMEARTLLESCLHQLKASRLLEEPTAEPWSSEPLASRRRALRAVGLAGLAPLVLSIAAPWPAEAATCVPRNGNCTSSQQCCPEAPCCRPKANQPPTCVPGGGGCLP